MAPLPQNPPPAGLGRLTTRNQIPYQLIIIAVGLAGVSCAASAARATGAKDILGATGVKGGLVVHIGCGAVESLLGSPDVGIQGLRQRPRKGLGLISTLIVDIMPENSLEV